MRVMSVCLLMTLGLVAAMAEAPAAPYAPSGWRPKGPAFELPPRTEKKQPDTEYGGPDQVETDQGEDGGDNVDISEQEIQYQGEIGTTDATTPFQEYGPPDDQSTTDAVDDELTVQGLPGTEPAKEFRNLPENDIQQNRGQRIRVPARNQQKPARIQTSKVNQQFFSQQQFSQQQFARQQQFGNAQQFGAVNPNTQQFSAQRPAQRQYKQSTNNVVPARIQTQQFGTKARAPVAFQQQFAPVQNFGARQNLQARPAFNQRLTSQRQEALDSYGAPAQPNYGPPANEYGTPQNEYGTPEQVTPQPETDVDQPEDLPQEDLSDVDQPQNEDAPEANDVDSESDSGVAVSNAVATGRYVQLKGRPQRLTDSRRSAPAKLRVNTLQQITDPVYMYNQFGQLVRIF